MLERCGMRQPVAGLNFEPLESRWLFSFGLTPTANSYIVDVGANLVFAVNRTTALGGSIGDLTSMKYNGTELEAPFSATSRYSHYESGLSSSTIVTATVDPAGNWIMITCDDTAGTGVIQYYIAHKGDNDIYMATYTAGPDAPSPGEMRFITYTNHSVLVNAPPQSNLTGNTGAIESTDVVGFADGTTASKYYGEYEAVDTQTYGLTGGGFGVFMNIGNRESSSGGPFFKDIDYQTTSAQSTELYNYMFSGHSQTEDFRPGLQGPYALQFTTGATPAAPDYSFIDGLGLAGWISPSGRGTLTGTASDVPAGHQVTVALSNATAQYWATPSAINGAYTISGIKPGTYTETLYQDELAVGTQTVTIAAGTTSTTNITDTYYIPPEIFSIGTFDGTPIGFLNADKFPDMHPSDSRMTPWVDTTFTVGVSTPADWPMAEWKDPSLNPVNTISFTLTAQQAATPLTLRIALTRTGVGGRTIINVNNGAYNSPTPAAPTEPSTRGVTLGNWRGNNVMFTYSIPTSALHAGTNTIAISVNSGSSGSLYLSPWVIFDAIDLVTTSSLTNAPHVASVAVTSANSSVNVGGQQTFVATARDQFGNVIPANFVWSASRGTVDQAGDYIAPVSPGGDTIMASAGTLHGSIGVTVLAASSVAGRDIFYSGSVFDSGNHQGAIAPDKTALLPGQTASFANYTSYSRGLNGIIVDIANLTQTLTATDFIFRVGNDDSPSAWSAAPAPLSVVNIPGAGAGGSTRVVITWADNAIQNEWLQVTLQGGAGSASGLASDDIFYFGNTPGEVGNDPANTLVDAVDQLSIRYAATGSAAITNVDDVNRDGKVDAADENVARGNQTYFLNELQLISVPADAGAELAPALMTTMLKSDSKAVLANAGQLPAPAASSTVPAPIEDGSEQEMPAVQNVVAAKNVSVMLPPVALRVRWSEPRFTAFAGRTVATLPAPENLLDWRNEIHGHAEFS
jgi:rhamnogalacturonan endolyase